MSVGQIRARAAQPRGILPGTRLVPVLLLLTISATAISAGFLGGVVATKGSKVYHTHPQECPAARRINPDNLIHFASAEEAEASGRRLCKTCADLDRRISEGGQSRPPSERSPKRKPADSRGGEPERREEQVEDEAGLAGVLPEYAGVAAVLPGGTIELDTGEKAALCGVVCPAAGQPCAEEAVRFIREQTAGRRVRLVADRTPGGARPRDSLGRLVVYLAAEPDGRDLGAELLFQGYAWLDRQIPFERRREYVMREEEAWRGGRGIWQPLAGPAGERQVVTGRFAENYHDPRCPHVAHLAGKITLTVNEAKARRLTPCSHFRGDKASSRGAAPKRDKERRKDDTPSEQEDRG